MVVKSKHVKRKKEDTCFLFSCFFIFCKLFKDVQEFFPSLFFFFVFYGCYLLPFFYEQRALHFTSPPFPFLLSFLLFVQNVAFVRSNPVRFPPKTRISFCRFLERMADFGPELIDRVDQELTSVLNYGDRKKGARGDQGRNVMVNRRRTTRGPPRSE